MTISIDMPTAQEMQKHLSKLKKTILYIIKNEISGDDDVVIRLKDSLEKEFKDKYFNDEEINQYTLLKIQSLVNAIIRCLEDQGCVDLMNDNIEGIPNLFPDTYSVLQKES